MIGRMAAAAADRRKKRQRQQRPVAHAAADSLAPSLCGQARERPCVNGGGGKREGAPSLLTSTMLGKAGSKLKEREGEKKNEEAK